MVKQSVSVGCTDDSRMLSQQIIGSRIQSFDKLSKYPELWSVCFDFDRPDGSPPRPTRLRGFDSPSGRSLDVARDEFRGMVAPPLFARGKGLLVAYDAPSTLGCMLSLGWDLPADVLDLEVEFRCHCSGLNESGDWSLERALDFYGVKGTGDIPMALQDLLHRMLSILDFDRALLRGRYTAAVARMEQMGVPIDRAFYERLKARWPLVRASLIERVDRDYGIFDGTTFRERRWERWLETQGIPWPRQGCGTLCLDDDTFKMMALVHPREVGPMWELRRTLSRLRIEKLAIGADGRNRTPLRPFASLTGRNQPSTSRFIYGAPAWVRSLIKPEPDTALAYVDYEQQEFGIAAALSGDSAMKEAYATGDPYLGFARQAGAVPQRATSQSHREDRERFKLCALGIQYGMGASSLASLIGGSMDQARGLIKRHRAVYQTYWEWSTATERNARASGAMHTVFGWRLNVHEHTKPGTVRNFPLQANGAEILRLACCLVMERGISVCAPVHDAILIQGPSARIDEAVSECQQAMAEAAGIVLGGFPMRTDAKVVRYPERYMDERGRPFWGEVCGMIGQEGI